MSNLYLIAYDITDTKKRTKVAELLEGYGERVNFSVFECLLTKSVLEKVIEEIEQLIHLKHDSVKIYFVCKECYSKSITLGKKPNHPPKATHIF